MHFLQQHIIFALLATSIFSFEFTLCSENLVEQTLINSSSNKNPTSSTTTGFKILSEEETTKHAVRCGEIYNTTTGSVFYKPFQEVLDNERCAWVIAVPEAEGYTIEVQYLGSPTNEQGSEQELVLTGVRQNNINPPILSAYRPETTGIFSVPDVNIIIVSFASPVLNGSPSTGFSFRYEGIKEGNITKSSSSSTHHLLDQSIFEWKYPVNATNYDVNELAAFILSPIDNHYSGSPNHGWYKKGSMSPNCYDGIYIYSFSKSSGDNNPMVWSYVDSICADRTTLHFTYEDMLLMIFKSITGTATGFWLTAVSCQCS